MSLQPLQGVLVKLDDRGKIVEEKVILAQLIQRGDLLKVVPGETIPTDGRIFQRTTINETVPHTVPLTIRPSVGIVSPGTTLRRSPRCIS